MDTIKKWFRRIKLWLQEETGLGLVETLAAVTILGAAVITFIIALSTGSLAVRESDQEQVAQSLVRSQLEYIKNCAYNPAATTYPEITTVEGYEVEGYDISVAVSSIPDTNTDIQKITVTISRDGEGILTTENYKVNR